MDEQVLDVTALLGEAAEDAARIGWRLSGDIF